MFIQELIFIYCDKIINSNGTNGSYFSVFASFSRWAFHATFLYFDFWLNNTETKERQTDCCNDISIWQGDILYISCMEMHRTKPLNIIKIYYVLQCSFNFCHTMTVAYLLRTYFLLQCRWSPSIFCLFLPLAVLMLLSGGNVRDENQAWKCDWRSD